MWPDKRLINLFGIEHPILQAPMAGANGIEMAAAVSQVGGLGAMPCATIEPDSLAAKLDALRQRTPGPVNLNFFAHARPLENTEADAKWIQTLAPYYKALGVVPPAALAPALGTFEAAHCDVLQAFRPAVVSFHFGLPKAVLVQRIKAMGAKIISSATTIAEAVWLEQNGCDAIIAQGIEAGGHRGMFQTNNILDQMGTMALVPQIVDAISVPVIAAGGIADGRGIAAAFALGAASVSMGTAYLYTEEATISPLYRQSLNADPTTGTAISNVFSGRPARVLRNKAVHNLGPLNDRAPAFPKGFSALAGLRKASEANQKWDFSAHYAGEAATLGTPNSAKNLTQQLIKDAQKRLKSLSP